MFRRVWDRRALGSGEMRPCEIAGRRILLINNDGEVSAFADRCAHRDVPLRLGLLVGTTLTCAHEWQYDARTGAGLNPPDVSLQRFLVQLRGEGIWVDLDAPERPDRALGD